jgi:predicted AlkP superfamily pyrophosphatase or phosphodiesterase
MLRILLLLTSLFPFYNCKNNGIALSEPVTYATKNVVVVVIDGPRYSETWGSENHALIPNLANNLAPEGVINTRFFNAGPTYTNAGHAAIMTGVYQEINNAGREYPRNPSYMQIWLQATGQPSEKAWIVTSKDKLNILANTKHISYTNQFLPMTDCGVNGPSSGYREDSVTVRVAKKILKEKKPNLMLVNLKEPDASGHAGNWKGYLQGIKSSDEYVWQLWNFLQADPQYKNSTTLIVTNDHGRHSDNFRDGFVSHGDNCESCRHIFFFAAGPDFKQNSIIAKTYNQTDIPATIAELMGINMPTGKGKVMWELFKNK